MRWVMEALMELSSHPVPAVLIFAVGVASMAAFMFITI